MSLFAIRANILIYLVPGAGIEPARGRVRSIEAAKPGEVLTDSSLGKGSGKLVLRVRATEEWYFRYRLDGRSLLILLCHSADGFNRAAFCFR
jgi:hypothetical protein